MTHRSQIYDLKHLTEQQSISQISKLFDKNDFHPDSIRDDILVYTDEAKIDQTPELSIFSRDFKGDKTPQLMHEALQKCELLLWPKDNRSLQETVIGYPSKRSHRLRFYANNFKIFRLEMSRDLLPHLEKFHSDLFGKL